MALITSAVIGTAALVGTYTSARKQAKAQAKSIRAQQRQADIANARERRQQVRNARVARASVENQAALTGVSGSSGVAGAVANIGQQLGENISFLDQNAALSNEASIANQQAAGYASQVAGYQALGSAGNLVGQYGDDIFSKKS